MPKFELISQPIEPNGDILISQEIYDKARAAFTGKRVHITIEEFSPKHSKEARRYLMGAIVAPLADAIGRPKKEMWEMLKCKLRLKELYIADGPDKGEIFMVYDSTQDYTRQELHEFTQEAKSWAEDLGVPIETSEQYYERRAMEKAKKRALKQAKPIDNKET
jgi:hypothetical protein